MEQHTIAHIRTVLLITLSITVLIILYVRLLQYFKKDMDKRQYAVLLPITFADGKALINIEVPGVMEVTLQVLDEQEELLETLVEGVQEDHVKLELREWPERAYFLRMVSNGQQVLRRIEA